jgi:hypothetical protein
LTGGGSASSITIGMTSPLPVANGGTNATTAPAALTSLGAASAAAMATADGLRVLKAGDTMTGDLIVNPGNVGIGTAGPGSKLEVNGDVALTGTGNLRLNGGGSITRPTTGDSLTLSTLAGTSLTQIGLVATATYTQVDFTAYGNVTLWGNVGIGVTPTAGGLVVGSPTGGSLGAGKINSVEVRANNVVLTSDQDLKTDIEPLTQALSMLAAIEPKSFHWLPLPPPAPAVRPDGTSLVPPPTDPGFTEKLNRGFVVQDVIEVLGGKAEDGVDLGGMVAVLWQAVRELSDRVAELEGDKPAARPGRH